MKKIKNIDTVNNLKFIGSIGSNLGSDSFKFEDDNGHPFFLSSKEFTDILLNDDVYYNNNRLSNEQGFQAALHNYYTFFTKDSKLYDYFLKMTTPTRNKISMNTLKLGDRVELDYSKSNDYTFICKINRFNFIYEYVIIHHHKIVDNGDINIDFTDKRLSSKKEYLMYNNKTNHFNIIPSSRKVINFIDNKSKFDVMDPEFCNTPSSTWFLNNIVNEKFTKMISPYDIDYILDKSRSRSFWVYDIIDSGDEINYFGLDFSKRYKKDHPTYIQYKKMNPETTIKSHLIMENKLPFINKPYTDRGFKHKNDLYAHLAGSVNTLDPEYAVIFTKKFTCI